MDRMDYIQAVTRTRVLETRLLSRAIVERMVDAKDMEEVIKILGETEYAHATIGLTRFEEYEKILSAELKRVYDLMYEMAKDKIVVDLLALKYDYHNLKALVKEKYLKEEQDDIYIPLGITDFSKIREAYLTDDLRDIDPKLRDALETVTKDFEENKDPQRIDLLMDNFYFQHLHGMAKETEIPLFINYVEDLIDFTNIRTLLRVRKQKKDINFLELVISSYGNIPKEEILLLINEDLEVIKTKLKTYRTGEVLKKGLETFERTDRLSEFEQEMDNYLIELIKPSLTINFGPEPLFSYVLAKEAEIKILRIIMVSKLNKLSPDAIRERLRDLYV
jgi:V/A-type H+-transporting ATPase subunit C